MELEPAKTLTGTIRALYGTYGFVREEVSRRDFFFHQSELVNASFRDLRPGMTVEFFGIRDERERYKGKLRAVDVVIDNALGE